MNDDRFIQPQSKFYNYGDLLWSIIIALLMLYILVTKAIRMDWNNIELHWSDLWLLVLVAIYGWAIKAIVASAKKPMVVSSEGIFIPKDVQCLDMSTTVEGGNYEMIFSNGRLMRNDCTTPGEDFQLKWSEINRIEIIKKGFDDLQLQVGTTLEGKILFTKMLGFLMFRRKRFEAQVEMYSGKPFGEEISPIVSRKNLPDSGKYEVDERNGYLGIIDTGSKRAVLPFKYDDIDEISMEEKDELIYVCKGDLFGFVDTATWQVTIPVKYTNCYTFKEGVTAVEYEEGKWHFVDRENKVAIKGPFEDGGTFSEGISAAKMGGKYGFIDHQGKTVIPYQYDEAGSFQEGFAPVAVADDNGKLRWGYINKSGSIEIGCQYDIAWTFSEGLAPVKVGKLWGAINKEGMMTVPLRYSYVDQFKNGRAEAITRGFLGTRLGRKTIHIDIHGTPVKGKDASD